MCVTSPDQNYRVRRYEPTDKSPILSILGQVWGPATQRRMAATWDWKFEHNPHNLEAGHQSLVIEHQGNPVGFLGYQCARFQIGTKLSTLAWGSELCVQPEHRGQGYLVMRHIAEKEGITVMGNAGNPAIHDLQTRFGAFQVTRWVNCKLILKGRHYLAARGLARPAAALAGWGLDAITSLSRVVARPPGPRNMVREIPCFDDRFDSLWATVADGGLALAVRDRAFLDWRFSQCPNRKYHILEVVEGGQLRGYVVVRIEDLEGVPRGLIVDILAAPDDHSCWADLVIGAADFLGARGAAIVSCTVAATFRPLLSTLHRAGFLLRSQGIPLTAHVGCDEDQKALGRVLRSPTDLFLTRADSDLDFNS